MIPAEDHHDVSLRDNADQVGILILDGRELAFDGRPHFGQSARVSSPLELWRGGNLEFYFWVHQFKEACQVPPAERLELGANDVDANSFELFGAASGSSASKRSANTRVNALTSGASMPPPMNPKQR